MTAKLVKHLYSDAPALWEAQVWSKQKRKWVSMQSGTLDYVRSYCDRHSITLTGDVETCRHAGRRDE